MFIVAPPPDPYTTTKCIQGSLPSALRGRCRKLTKGRKTAAGVLSFVRSFFARQLYNNTLYLSHRAREKNTGMKKKKKMKS